MYGLAQGLGDFAGGFNNESTAIRREQQDQADRDAAIEQKGLEHLANSDDPDLRAAAVTAMLTPKKGAAATGFQKWFGQQRSHPVYDQVKSLIGGGSQPFLSVEDKAAQGRSGLIRGATEGYASGMRNEGYEPTEEAIGRVAMGAAGAPQRVLPKQYGTLKMKDGTTIAGSFDQSDGHYEDQDGNYIDEVASFTRGNGPAANPNSGGAWSVIKDPASPTGFSRVHTDAAGKELGRVPGVQGPPPESLSPVITPGGILSYGTKSGTVTPAKGGANVSQPAPATADFETLKSLSDDIQRRASSQVFHAAGLPVDQKELGPILDAEAKKVGWQDWNSLQAALGQAQSQVGARVQPAPAADAGAPPEGITPPAPRTGPAPAPRRTAPAPGAKPKGGKPTAGAGQPGQLDVQKILQELNKF